VERGRIALPVRRLPFICIVFYVVVHELKQASHPKSGILLLACILCSLNMGVVSRTNMFELTLTTEPE
jgi:hypothetical protein